MTFLFLRAYAHLLCFEKSMARNDFSGIYHRVQNHARKSSTTAVSCQDVCRAINLACALYFKELQCLQRSAALVCLLRDFGIPATMVIGAQRLPFRAHAWAEVNGQIVNDSAAAVELYGVLDRL